MHRPHLYTCTGVNSCRPGSIPPYSSVTDWPPHLHCYWLTTSPALPLLPWHGSCQRVLLVAGGRVYQRWTQPHPLKPLGLFHVSYLLPLHSGRGTVSPVCVVRGETWEGWSGEGGEEREWVMRVWEDEVGGIQWGHKMSEPIRASSDLRLECDGADVTLELRDAHGFGWWPHPPLGIPKLPVALWPPGLPLHGVLFVFQWNLEVSASCVEVVQPWEEVSNGGRMAGKSNEKLDGCHCSTDIVLHRENQVLLVM